MSFWIAEDKVPIEQTQTAIAATNGLNYSPGQVIHIDVPPTSKYFKPKDCFLQWDVKLSVDTAQNHTRLQLDAEIGAQSLIRNLRIYTSPESGGVLLEEIQDYNTMVAVKYSYDTDDSKKNLRAINGEGSTAHKRITQGTKGTVKSQCADITTNPYFKSSRFSNDETNASDQNKLNTVFNNDTDRLTAKCCLPIHSGIFSSERVWPNVLTGLRLEIELEQADVCVRQLESVLLNQKLALNPVFDSVNGSNDGGKNEIATGDDVTTFYITTANSQVYPYQCPFVVGEYINFSSPEGAAQAEWNRKSSGEGDTPQIKSITFDESASDNEGLVVIELEHEMTLTSASTIQKGWALFSSEMGPHVSTGSHAITTAPQVSYLLSNPELIISELDIGQAQENMMMKSMKEGGVMVMDILSVQNYKYSQLKSDIVANIRLPLDFSRARSIVCVPTDSTSYSTFQRVTGSTTYQVGDVESPNVTTKSTRTGLVGISDNLTNYQFLYDGKLQPSRAVSTKKISGKTSIDAQPLIETEKALVQADIECRSFAQFNENFLICRALSLNSGVYDCRGLDFNLQVNYQGTAPLKNKLWKNFVWHLRRISIKGDTVSVDR